MALPVQGVTQVGVATQQPQQKAEVKTQGKPSTGTNSTTVTTPIQAPQDLLATIQRLPVADALIDKTGTEQNFKTCADWTKGFRNSNCG